ncbi:MAG: hypothetical protein IAF02_23340 [Anaerolineae bacterium]|nr:hypothetical protein [Anaerolineae bacterium]
MMEFIVLVHGLILFFVILGASFFLGWFIVNQVQTQRPFVGTRSELIFACLSLGIIVIGWLAFILAEVGFFSILALILLWGGLCLFFILRIQRHKSGWRVTAACLADDKRLLSFLPNWVESVALGIWLIVAVLFFFRPHQFITGAADAGVYVNLGVNVAETGSILIQDDVLASFPTGLYSAFLRPISNIIAPYYILPGFSVVGEPAGEIIPQFYHLHPVWQAIAYSLGGVQVELMLTGFWTLLGSLAIYFTVRRLVGWEIALLALAGLTLNAMQVWFARYPTTEPLTQFLLWTGLWSLSVWIEDTQERPLWGLLAGLALGQTFLVRIDMLFILPIFMLFGVWLWARNGWKREYNWFFLPLFLLVLHSLVHALWQGQPYFFELFGFALRLLSKNWIIPVTAAIGLLVLVVGLGRYRRQFVQLVDRYQRPLLTILILSFILWAIYGWFIRPNVGEVIYWNDPYGETTIPQLNHENLIRIGWYLSPLGVWLGIAGISLWLWKVNGTTAVMLATTLLFSIIYITNIRATNFQIYAMRRYVPATMPVFIIGGAYFLGWLASYKKSITSSLALILALAWLGGFVWLSRGFISQVDYQGILPQIDQLDAKLAPGSILIFNDPAPIGQGDLLGTPLRFLKGHYVLTLRDSAALDEDLFDQTLQQWQEQGYNIYWIMVPDGHTWPLSDWHLKEVGAYNIQADVLEHSFYNRPTQVINQQWRGEITQIHKEQ